MYHKIKIGNLSNTQISRLLNGHGVRISDGANHEIELSKEQLKKYKKALEKGKAMTHLPWLEFLVFGCAHSE